MEALLLSYNHKNKDASTRLHQMACILHASADQLNCCALAALQPYNHFPPHLPLDDLDLTALIRGSQCLFQSFISSTTHIHAEPPA